MPKLDKLPRYALRGQYAGNVDGLDRRAMLAVACPRCRMAKGWICTTANGKFSSTAHSARIEAYKALDSGANVG